MLVIAFLASVLGFLAWLAYVSYKDPAGIFRPHRRDSDMPGDGIPPGDADTSGKDGRGGDADAAPNS